MLHLTIKSLLINEKEEFLILKAVHLQQFKSTNDTDTECISSVYKGGTICSPLRSDMGAV